MSNPVQEAWQKADDDWRAAGSPTPCYDPAYLAAREELAVIMSGVGKSEPEAPVRKLPDWRNPVDER